VQILDKDNEILFLQYQIEKALVAGKVKEANLQATESVIATLTERSDAERAMRSKAQLALAQKAQELQQCVQQRDATAAEVERCGNQIHELTSKRYGSAASILHAGAVR
jgi:hypothetical protein